MTYLYTCLDTQQVFKVIRGLQGIFKVFMGFHFTVWFTGVMTNELLTDIIYSWSWRLRKRKKGLKNILLRNLLHKFVLVLFWGRLSMQVVFIWELCTLWFGPLKFKEDQINYYDYISFKLYIVGLGKNVWTAPYLYWVWNGRTPRKPRKRGRGRNLSVDSRNIHYFGNALPVQRVKLPFFKILFPDFHCYNLKMTATAGQPWLPFHFQF